MRRRTIRASLFVILFLLFLLLMDYPYLSRIYNDMISGEVIASYGKSEDPDDCAARRKWAGEYNRYLAGEGDCPSRYLLDKYHQNEDQIPWESAARILCMDDAAEDDTGKDDIRKDDTGKDNTGKDNTGKDNTGKDNTGKDDIGTDDIGKDNIGRDDINPDDTVYGETDKNDIRKAGAGRAGWIGISALDLMLPLYIGTGDDALRNGAGILEESSLPVGGASTHTCISAHRGLPDRTLFTNLDLLKNGDLIRVHTLGQTLCYEVTDSETVLPTQTEHLKIRRGEDLLTLITCTPYGINTHRLYVHARRCSEQKGDGKEQSPDRRGFLDPLFWKLWWWVPATIVLLLIMIVLVRQYLKNTAADTGLE